MAHRTKLAITISYPTSASGIIVLLNFFKLQMSGYLYNWILVNFTLNITKRPDINVTPGKNHMTCVLFVNLVE